MRDDSAWFQRVEVPPRCGLQAPGSYSEGRAVRKDGLEAEEDKRRLKETVQQVRRPNKSRNDRRCEGLFSGFEISKPDADPP